MASAMAAVVPPYPAARSTRRTGTAIHVRQRAVRRRWPAAVHTRRRHDDRARTPAACALAIRALAAPGSRTAALIGAGRQGWTISRCWPRVARARRDVRRRRHRGDAVADVVARANAAGIPAVAASTPDAAVDGAEVIVTVTQSSGAVVPAPTLSATAR